MRLSEHQQEFSLHIAKLILYADSIGIKVTLGEAYRTTEQQQIYVSTGKSKTMNSNHLRRLAVDFNFFIDGRLTYRFDDVERLGDYWESLSHYNRWGGDWNNNEVADGWLDTPHFERNV